MNIIKTYEEHKLEKNQEQLLEYIENLSNNSTFVFIDTETTGLGGHKKQQLTQISAIASTYDFESNDFSIVDQFNKKIKLTKEIIDSRDRKELVRILKFNRYGENNVKYIDEKKCLTDFVEWVELLKNPLFIIQNAAFDMDMLCGRFNNPIKYPVLDTKQIIGLFIIPIVEKLSETDDFYKNALLKIGRSDRDYGLWSSSMSKWAPFFNIPLIGYHNALDDCKITMNLYTSMINFIKEHKHLNIQKYQMNRIRVR